MKKKILIVDKSFEVGGIQSSMINMVNELKDEYDIDICVFNNSGKLKERLDKSIKVFEPSFLFKMCGIGQKESREKGMIIYALRTAIGIFNRIFTNRLYISLACLFQKKLKGYDVAIAFHHEDSIKATVSGFYRFVQRMTDAPLKLGWVHYDSKYVTFDDSKNIPYMEKMDKLICVSKGCAEAYKKRHPELKVPIEYCYNFHQYENMVEKSFIDMVEYKHDAMNFLTVARIAKEKGHYRALKIFDRLKKEGHNFYWHIVGGSDEKTEKEFRDEISRCNLSENVIMYSSQENPYRFFRDADVFLLPSYHEAAPMVFSEAEALKLPIIGTVTLSSKELVTDKNIGIICRDDDELYDAMKSVIVNPDTLNEYKKAMETHCADNSIARKQFRQFIG